LGIAITAFDYPFGIFTLYFALYKHYSFSHYIQNKNKEDNTVKQIGQQRIATLKQIHEFQQIMLI
jgi:hypothetical protein